ncbi:FAD-dependent oxidoreductase [Nocardia sp. NPDC052254]|uniref:NAD(P)/FAD-dependent oxidoreductase n=1 Tax=Nocardia sp. NPDC052254 TaxID=3155681 RepID=UPI00344AA58E
MIRCRILSLGHTLNDRSDLHHDSNSIAQHVVLLGAGYVCIWAYRALRRRFGHEVTITVVSPAQEHVFHGFTGEVLSGAWPSDAQLSPLTEVFPKAERVHGRATAVNRDERTVAIELADGGTGTLHYDHLVIGTGAVENVESVPGLQEYGFRLRDAGRTAALAAHLDECVAAGGSQPPRVAVVGAGLAGVEAAVAIAQRLADAANRTGATAPGEVVLIGAADAVGYELSPRLREQVGTELSRNKIRLLAPARVVRVSAAEVELDDGDPIAVSTVVAAVGNRVRPLPGLDDLPVDDRGALITDDRLQIAPGIWAGGDAASVPLPSGEPCPLDASWAIGQGTWVGRNISRVIRGTPQRPFTWRSVGVTAGFGRGRAVLDAWGMGFRGWPAWASRLAFFLFYLPSRRHALRVIAALVRR